MNRPARSIEPLELIRAHTWRRATFTTYSFSASFAEAVLIEALMRQGVSDITILTDQFGYKMALRERGAVQIGREYVVHPVAVRRGCFHPKLMVLEADDATHVTVGSNNLTFGGWYGNLECIEHIHTAGMAGAVGDVGSFFTALADADNCVHEARQFCRDLGKRLAVAAAAGTDDCAVKVLNSLDVSIAEHLQTAAAALGGAKALTIASPYWESSAIEQLAKGLGLSEIRAHVPVARVPAPEGMDWPRKVKALRPVRIKHLAVENDVNRGLHAKVFEVVCARGRLVLSGSANATKAALGLSSPKTGNIEVCVLRTDGRARGRWAVEEANAPSKPKVALDGEGEDDKVGVLVAARVDDGIKGRILTPWRSASAKATMEVGRRVVTIGTVEVDAGAFAIPIGWLDDEELFLVGRIQLRLEDGSEVAEGFVTAPDFGVVRSYAGSALPHILNVMKNLQTPEDVLAVIEFIRANPETLRTPPVIRHKEAVPVPTRVDRVVDAELVARSANGDRGNDNGNDKGGSLESREELIRQRFIGNLLRAFGKRPAPAEDDDEDESDRTAKARQKRGAQSRGTLLVSFPGLFTKMTATIGGDAELVNVARLTHFVCVTTEHPSTGAFLARLIGKAKTVSLGTAAKDMLAFCIAQLAAAGTMLDAASARGRMLALGIDPHRVPEPDCALPGFGDLIAPHADLDEVFAAIRATRTVHDDIRRLEEGLMGDVVPDGLEVLAQHPSWRKLLEQCGREPARRRIRFVDQPLSACSCNKVLPHIKDELARDGVCDTRCHGFILVRNL